MQIAGFEKRVFAFLIDYLFAIALSITLFIFVFSNLMHLSFEWSYFLVPLFSSIFFVIFVGTMSYLLNGITIGNIIFNLKMVSIKYQRLSARQVYVKYLTLSLIPCSLVNALYMLLKHTEKTIFDELSHTVSISMR